MTYVIVTPAHNEESHLERVIASVLSQTCKPLRWVIVNDRSTDRTEEIARRHAEKCEFIRVLSIDSAGDHGFSKKAVAFNAGVASLSALTFDFIGNLDADIELDADYFAGLLRAFKSDPQLGVTGGMIFTSIKNKFVTYDKTIDSVAGAVQMFRRSCFEDVGGGYLPLPFGGIDAAAEIIAKQKGWRVAKQPEFRVREYRQTGTAAATPLAAQFRLGRRFHSLGYSAAFFAARCLYRLVDAPMVIGSVVSFLGYATAVLRRQPVMLPAEVVQNLRREQHRKLLRPFLRTGP